MIVGLGDIASVLEDRAGALIFAAGVSNSACEDTAQFSREVELLMSFKHTNDSVFYFSSIGVGLNIQTPYFLHKKRMERLIESNFNHYNILRLGNISWGKNPNTFINYIRERKRLGEPYTIRDELKYVIDAADLVKLVNSLPLKGTLTISVFSRIGKVENFI